MTPIQGRACATAVKAAILPSVAPLSLGAAEPSMPIPQYFQAVFAKRLCALPWALSLALTCCQQPGPVAQADSPAISKGKQTVAPTPSPPKAATAVTATAVTASVTPPATAEQHVCDQADPTCQAHPGPPSQRPSLSLAGDRFGNGVSLDSPVPIEKILADPDKYAGQRVRVEGEVTDVCQMRGCWFEFKDDAGTRMRFKVIDGTMTFRQTDKGRYAVAEGSVRKMPLTLEQTVQFKRHEAAEMGKPFDPASVKEPMVIVRIDGDGAVIRDQK